MIIIYKATKGGKNKKKQATIISLPIKPKKVKVYNILRQNCMFVNKYIYKKQQNKNFERTIILRDLPTLT